MQGRRLGGQGRGGQLPATDCPLLSGSPPLPFVFLMHKIGENQPGMGSNWNNGIGVMYCWGSATLIFKALQLMCMDKDEAV